VCDFVPAGRSCPTVALPGLLASGVLRSVGCVPRSLGSRPVGLRVGPLIRCGLLNCVCSAAHRSWGGGILSRDVPVGKTQGYALRVVKAVPHGHRFTPVTQCDVSFLAAGWWVGAVLGCYVPSRPSRAFSPFFPRGGSCTLVYSRLPFRVRRASRACRCSPSLRNWAPPVRGSRRLWRVLAGLARAFPLSARSRSWVLLMFPWAG